MYKILNPICELDKPDSGKIVTPDTAYLIKDSHSFYCPDHDCKDPDRILVAARSKLGRYFFKHKPNCQHDIHPETLLHKLAVKWFEDKETIEIPSFTGENFKFNKQMVNFDKTQTKLEYRKLEKIIPDIIIVTESRLNIAIEIVVTSDIGDEKRKLIDEFNLPTIRIDLSSFYMSNQDQCRKDYSFVNSNLENLLIDIELKSWVIPPKLSDIENKLEFHKINERYITQSNSSPDKVGCLIAITTIGIAPIVWKLMKRIH